MGETKSACCCGGTDCVGGCLGNGISFGCCAGNGPGFMGVGVLTGGAGSRCQAPSILESDCTGTYGSGCLYTELILCSEEGDTVVYILTVDGANTNLILEVDGETVATWVPQDPENYDPLCTQIFELDEENTTWENEPTLLCVQPDNGCCDSFDQRSTGLPGSLDVALEAPCHCGDGLIEFTIGWDADESAWVGSTTVCDDTLEIKLECIGGTGVGPEGFQLTIVNNPNSGCLDTGTTYTPEENGTCDPLFLEFGTTLYVNCCSAMTVFDPVISISEP